MNQEVKRWIEENGGLGSIVAEPPDANGTRIYRAPNGQFIAVRGSDGGISMRGFRPPEEGAAQQPGPAPADPSQSPAAPRGAGMTQQELEALLAKMGALGDKDFREETKNEDAPNPKYDGSDITVPPTIKQPVTYRTWVKPGTNQRLTVKVNTDGSYTQVFSGADPQINPSKAPDQGQTVPTNTTEPFIVTRMPDGSLKSEPNPNYQGNKPKDPQVTTFDGNLVRIHPDGRVETLMQGKPENKSAVIDGQLWERGEDGTWRPVAGEKKPDRVVVNGVPYERGADGTYKPLPGVPTDGKDDYPAEPPGAPNAPLTVGNLTTGLKAYSEWLDQQVLLYKQSGGKQGIAPEKATGLMQRRIQLAESAIKEQQTTSSQQAGLLGNATTQRGQSLGDVQNRRAAANAAMQTVQSAWSPLLKGLRPGDEGAAVGAYQEMLQNALGYANQWGGMQNVPEVGLEQFPALAQIRGAGGPGPVTSIVGAPPPAAQNAGAGTGEPPSRGAIPSNAPAAPPSMTPEQAAAQRAAAVQNAGGVLPPPIFAPQPPAVMKPPVEVPVAVNPIDQSPIVVPPRPQTQGMMSMDLTGYRPQQQTPPPMSNDMVRGRMDQAMAFNRGGPVETWDAGGMMQTPRFMQQARYGEGGFWDGETEANDMMSRLGISPDIMRQAMAGMGG